MAAIIMESADVGSGFSESLARKLTEGSLPVVEGLHIATGIASALRELHQKGLIHGDVRTESVWVDAEGAILEARGTRCQMADPKVDVKAFGSVLYEIFSGNTLPANAAPPPYTPVTAPATMDDIRLDAMRLGERCHSAQLDVKQALIELKILTFQSRRLLGAKAAPAMETEAAPAAIVETAPEPVQEEEVAPSPAWEEARLPWVCPRCHGPVPADEVTPQSLVERILNRIGPLRECQLCGFRLVVIRVRRAR